MIDHCPKKKKRDRLKAVSIAAFLFLSLVSISPCSAQGLIGAPELPAYHNISNPVGIDESDRRNYLPTLVIVLLFLNLGIPLFNRCHWWKKHWPTFSFSVPLLAGATVGIFYNTYSTGIENPLLDCLTTGMLIGTSNLVTAAIFHLPGNMAPEAWK
jgi:hypothetical protein